MLAAPAVANALSNDLFSSRQQLLATLDPLESGAYCASVEQVVENKSLQLALLFDRIPFAQKLQQRFAQAAARELGARRLAALQASNTLAHFQPMADPQQGGGGDLDKDKVALWQLLMTTVDGVAEEANRSLRAEANKVLEPTKAQALAGLDHCIQQEEQRLADPAAPEQAPPPPLTASDHLQRHLAGQGEMPAVAEGSNCRMAVRFQAAGNIDALTLLRCSDPLLAQSTAQALRRAAPVPLAELGLQADTWVFLRFLSE
ncbi:MAG: hypothetical protein ABWY06_02085 [Pseudomonas sp.]|uniref:hypothetical protein n=1 Tax=Pseudomonas sp. TaxID=306 RepID=UPI003391C37C